MMRCMACDKEYKSKASLQAHQRDRCKTFRTRKKERVHLNPFFVACLRFFTGDICDIIVGYVGFTVPKISQHAEHQDAVILFLEIHEWFGKTQANIPLISAGLTFHWMNCLREWVYSRFKKIIETRKRIDTSDAENTALKANQTSVSTTSDRRVLICANKESILHNLILLHAVVEEIKRIKKHPQELADDISRWTFNVITKFENIRGFRC
jgi:hypothetical protein